jgi:hypothetical protein
LSQRNESVDHFSLVSLLSVGEVLGALSSERRSSQRRSTQRQQPSAASTERHVNSAPLQLSVNVNSAPKKKIQASTERRINSAPFFFLSWQHNITCGEVNRSTYNVE